MKPASRRIRHATIVATLGALAPFVAVRAQGGTPSVVSSAWLAAHLHDPSVVVLEVALTQHGDDTAYASAHIPGARMLRYRDISVEKDGLDTELPPAADVAKTLESLGVSNNSTVVVYGRVALAASRALFTLDYIGQRRIAYLDGGIAKWTAEHRPLSHATESITPGHITPHVRSGAVATADWVTAHAGRRGVSLIDTRSDGEYVGTGERHGMPSAGHIRGARQLQWQELFEPDEITLKDHATLAKLYADRVAKGDTVVTYCWVGYRASMTYFVARSLGYPVKLYDGSYEDWLKRKLPVTAGATP